jgi:serine/threonine-protein kinase HipA
MTKTSGRATASVSARAVATVDVYKGSTRAAVLERTERGAVLRYVPEYVASAQGERTRDVAFAMPVRAEPYEVFGTNLPAFFAGLLPEGLRMRVLVRSLKTSEDDLFSLLVASGADTVGDVAVALPGAAAPSDQGPVADTARLSENSFAELLDRSLRYHEDGGDVSIAGVQPKVSAAMITIPVRAKNKRRAYFLKLTPNDYPKLVENEAFFMEVAKSAGIEVAHTELVRDRSSASALLVERFDRVAQPDGSFGRLHQEDACQLLDRYPADKYRLSLRDLMSALEVCSAPTPERLKLLRMQAFSYLIVNGDMHAKNVSVRTLDGRTALAPAYDLLSTLPYGDAKLALALDGRDERLTRKHFTTFGERVGLRTAAVTQMLDRLCDRVAVCLPRLQEIGLESKPLNHLRRVMQTRLRELGPAS